MTPDSLTRARSKLRRELATAEGASSVLTTLAEVPTLESHIAGDVEWLAEIAHDAVLAAMREMESLFNNLNLYDAPEGGA